MTVSFKTMWKHVVRQSPDRLDRLRKAMTIGRSVLAVVAGVIVAGAVIAVTEMLIHALADGDAIFSAVGIGYGLGALAGTWLSVKISRARVVGIVVTALLAVLAVSNLFVIEHPVWFTPLAAVLLAFGWWTGDRFGLSGRRAVDG